MGPHCHVWAPSSCDERGLLPAAVRGPFTAVASPAAEHGLQVRRPQQLQHANPVAMTRGLQSAGPAAVAQGLSRSAARGILPDQGPNPCPLYWQVDPQPLRHQGSPHCWFLQTCIGTSLVAQWLKIRLPMQGTRIRALVQEDPTCCGAFKPVGHNC